MRLYYYKDGNDVYFMGPKDNGLWSFSLNVPDMDSLQLCETWVGGDMKDVVYRDGVVLSEEDRRIFDSVYNKEGNYGTIRKLICKYTGLEKGEVSKLFNRDKRLLKVIMESAVEYMRTRGSKVEEWEMSEIYRRSLSLWKMWERDEERLKRWLVGYLIGSVVHPDMTMVDVFGEMHPTKRKLYHIFHGCWGDDLDKLINEAVETYSDERDFDLAYYYVVMGLGM